MILREQLQSLSDNKKLFQFLQNQINVTEEKNVELQKFCTQFCSNISAIWKRSSRMLAQFIRKKCDWLECAINWPEGMIPEAINTAHERLEISNTEDVENVPPSNVLQKPRHLFLHLENLLKNWDPGKNEDALNKFTNRFRYPRMK